MNFTRRLESLERAITPPPAMPPNFSLRELATSELEELYALGVKSNEWRELDRLTPAERERLEYIAARGMRTQLS